MATFDSRRKKNGQYTHTATVRVKGFKSVSKTFDRLTDAREWASKTERDIKNNLNFPERKAGKTTIAEVIDRFIANKLPEYKPSIQREHLNALKWYKKEIGNLYLTRVTRADLVECREKLKQKKKEVPTKNDKTILKDKKLAPATINHYMDSMRAVFSYCVKDLDIIDINPMAKVEKIKVNNARKRYLNIDEISKLLNSCLEANYELFLCVLIALTTGARKGEILKLTWDNVDFEHKMFYFLETKNGTDRGTPIYPILIDELLKFKNQNKLHILKNDYLFKTKEGKPKEGLIGKLYPKIIKKCGIKDCTFHDLRHTHASWQAMTGTPLLYLQDIMGHKTPAMTSRYKHLMAEHKRQFIDKAGDVMLEGFYKSKQ